jgi:hypothetical protein
LIGIIEQALDAVAILLVRVEGESATRALNVVAHHLGACRDQCRCSFTPGLHQHDGEALQLRRVDERDRLGIGGAALLLVEEAGAEDNAFRLLGRRVVSAADEYEPRRIGTLGCMSHGVFVGDAHALAFLDPTCIEDVSLDPALFGEPGGRLTLRRVEAETHDAGPANPRKPSGKPLLGLGVEHASAYGREQPSHSP